MITTFSLRKVSHFVFDQTWVWATFYWEEHGFRQKQNNGTIISLKKTYNQNELAISLIIFILECKEFAIILTTDNINEIIGQVNLCNSIRGNNQTQTIDAVVFAGMGEPLLNYEQVKAAILVMRSRLGISHFELATVGIVPNIYELIKDFQGTDISIRLNISLHASSDDQRSLIIPMTERYDIYNIIHAAVDYAKAFGIKARIRYMLFRGFNDKEEDIGRLTDLLGGKPVKLIISQYNENNIRGLIPSGQLEVLEFHNKISEIIESEIFHNFGSDIQGGCGQLKQTMVV